jgi:hypothetical protein
MGLGQMGVVQVLGRRRGPKESTASCLEDQPPADAAEVDRRPGTFLGSVQVFEDVSGFWEDHAGDAFLMLVFSDALVFARLGKNFWTGKPQRQEVERITARAAGGEMSSQKAGAMLGGAEVLLDSTGVRTYFGAASEAIAVRTVFLETPNNLAIALIGNPSARYNRRISAQSSPDNTPSSSGSVGARVIRKVINFGLPRPVRFSLAADTSRSAWDRIALPLDGEHALPMAGRICVPRMSRSLNAPQRIPTAIRSSNVGGAVNIGNCSPAQNEEVGDCLRIDVRRGLECARRSEEGQR